MSAEPRLLYSAMMSLDGFISGPAGDQSWLTPYLGPNALVDSLMDDIGALLVGARTYFGDDPNKGTDEQGAFEGQWSGPQIVLTHRPPPATPTPDITYVDDVGRAVREAKAAAGSKKYVNVLGANVAQQCLQVGVLDEVLVNVAPVMLGDGVRLFDQPGGVIAELEPISASPSGTVTNLWYRIGQLKAYPLA